MRIVIAGASSGIGASLVEALASDGHALYVCARRTDRLEQVTRRNSIARGRSCDVSDEDQVVGFMSWVKGVTPHLDALINCAGGFGAIGRVQDTDSREWFDTVRANLFGTYLLVKHGLPLLAGSSRPRIITFSGGGAFNPFLNYSAYATSKAAVVRLTECLAAELAPQGILVNAVAPGFVATEIHEATLRAGAERAGEAHFARTEQMLKRGAGPVEVPVGCVRFLLSEAADGLTGKTISANFDPWGTETFSRHIPQITESDLYTLRRINIVNLAESPLKAALEAARNRGPDGS